MSARFFIAILLWRCAGINAKDLLINEAIRDKEVRVVDESGEQLGIMKSSEALKIAESRNLDLVKIAPKAVPPVCKIIDYGKYCYEQAKKREGSQKKIKMLFLSRKYSLL